MIDGRGWKVKICLHWAHLLSPVGSGICNPQQNSQWRLTHWCWSSMHSLLGCKDSSAFGWISPSWQLDGLWNLWRWKNLAKNLEMTTTTINGLCCEFNLIFHPAKSPRTHSVGVKYIACLPTKVVLDNLIFWLNYSHWQFDCHFLLLQRKILYLRRIWHQQLLRAE